MGIKYLTNGRINKIVDSRENDEETPYDDKRLRDMINRRLVAIEKIVEQEVIYFYIGEFWQVGNLIGWKEYDFKDEKCQQLAKEVKTLYRIIDSF